MGNETKSKDKVKFYSIDEINKKYRQEQDMLDESIKNDAQKEMILIESGFKVADNAIQSVKETFTKSDSDDFDDYSTQGTLTQDTYGEYTMIDYLLSKSQKKEVNGIQKYLMRLFIDAIDKQMKHMKTYTNEEILEIKKRITSEVKYLGVGYDTETNRCYYLHLGPDLSNSKKNKIYRYSFPYSITILDEEGETISEHTDFSDNKQINSYEELDSQVEYVKEMIKMRDLKEAMQPDKDMAYKIEFAGDKAGIKYLYGIVGGCLICVFLILITYILIQL